MLEILLKCSYSVTTVLLAVLYANNQKHSHIRLHYQAEFKIYSHHSELKHDQFDTIPQFT